ncbi:AbiH family protein [Sphingobacterium kitahiroshimense]|uniref:AbiH family protein n=1 Tax=Sphingobacterium kitahiroshimense TaxID=470446 RepID=UPI0032091B74
MNKLIIVGNGFDIHNKLPTKYTDFIIWYLTKCIESSIQSDGKFTDLIELKYNKVSMSTDYKKVTDFKDIALWFIEEFNFEPRNRSRHFIKDDVVFDFHVTSKSDLFLSLMTHQLERNWVDIEMTYYKILKQCLSLYNISDKEVFAEKKLEKINSDFEVLKSNLHKYLEIVSRNAKVDNTFDYCADDSINSRIIIDNHHLKNLEYDYKETKNTINPKEVTILNFNYTGLPYQLNRRRYNHIDIHGSVTPQSSPIIFGFGDEIDSDYLEMEKTNNNNFLTYIKSFGYFNDTNYKNLIDFIDSDSYVVYIWGHSCGLSDRTLLNMIFEHDNCAAIKPYYWEKNDKTNNYLEITQNISRHFRNKQKMRNRVVNKKFCTPLGSPH